MLIGLCALAVASEFQLVPGTGVSLVPPDGWEPSAEFTGFVEAHSLASILVLDGMEGVTPLMAASTTLEKARATFAANGIEVAARSEFRAASGHGCVLLEGSQTAHGVVVDKWIAMCAGGREAMVTLQIPRSASFPAVRAREVLRSVHLAPPAGLQEQLAALPFTIAPVSPFRIRQVIAGSSVLLPGGALDVDPTLSQPFIIVATQLSGETSTPASDACRAGHRLLKTSAKLPDTVVSREEPAVVAGRDGCLLAGTFTGPGSASRGFIQYVTILGSGQSLRALAIGDPIALAAVAPQVAQIAAEITEK